MVNIEIFDRARTAVLGLLIVLSLLLSALPASAAVRQEFDFLDATNITWERDGKKDNPRLGADRSINITWE